MLNHSGSMLGRILISSLATCLGSAKDVLGLRREAPWWDEWLRGHGGRAIESFTVSYNLHTLK